MDPGRTLPTTLVSDPQPDRLDWLPGDEAGPLEAALAYHAHGFRPIPIYAPSARGYTCRLGAACQAAGKHPIVRGWQRSHANERTVRARWTAWPSANVGLVTGGPARLVVLDVDGLEGQLSLRTLEEVHGALPETLTSATGGGDEQRLFRLAEDLDLEAVGNSVGKLGAGIDVRASGGQVVVAPSVHKSGRRYRWRNRVALAALPEWICELLAERPRRVEAWGYVRGCRSSRRSRGARGSRACARATRRTRPTRDPEDPSRSAAGTSRTS